MSPAVSSENFTPVRESYTERTGIPIERAQPALAGAQLPGWRLSDAAEATLTVSFTDVQDSLSEDLAPSSSGQFADAWENAHGRPIPIVASAKIPITYATYKRGRETVYLEAADTTEPLAQLWARSLTRLTELEQVPLGRGAATGPGAIIDAGEKLFRAHYSDGVDGRRLGAAEVDRRLNAAGARARTILKTLST
jgi:hypothetical protein